MLMKPREWRVTSCSSVSTNASGHSGKDVAKAAREVTFKDMGSESEGGRDGGDEARAGQQSEHEVRCCESLSHISLYARSTVGTESIQPPLNYSLFVSLQPFAKI